jgi:hypothetical protein
MIRIFLLAASLALAPTAACAVERDSYCRNGLFPIETASPALARVVGSGRSYFLGDGNGCPGAAAKCRQKAYVVAGDTLLTGKRQGAFVCVFFPTMQGGTAGWMSAARLKPLPVDKNPPVSAWVGHWKLWDNEIDIGSGRTGLTVTGSAYWPAKVPQGGYDVHEGSISGALRQRGNHSREPECNVTFSLVGDFLVAADPDGRCGGLNVNFTGVYMRKTR